MHDQRATISRVCGYYYLYRVGIPQNELHRLGVVEQMSSKLTLTLEVNLQIYGRSEYIRVFTNKSEEKCHIVSKQDLQERSVFA